MLLQPSIHVFQGLLSVQRCKIWGWKIKLVRKTYVGVNIADTWAGEMEKEEILRVVCTWGERVGPDTSWHHHCSHAGPLERRYSIKKVTSSHWAQNQSRNWLKLRYNSTCGLNLSWHFTVQFVTQISRLVPCHSQISGSLGSLWHQNSFHFSTDSWHLERETVAPWVIYHSAWGPVEFSVETRLRDYMRHWLFVK